MRRHLHIPVNLHFTYTHVSIYEYTQVVQCAALEWCSQYACLYFTFIRSLPLALPLYACKIYRNILRGCVRSSPYCPNQKSIHILFFCSVHQNCLWFYFFLFLTLHLFCADEHTLNCGTIFSNELLSFRNIQYFIYDVNTRRCMMMLAYTLITAIYT